MKRYGIRLVALLGAAAACRAAPYSGPVAGKVLLRYHPPVGARFPYALSQVSLMQAPNGPLASMNEQHAEVAMWHTLAVDSAGVQGERIALTVTIDSAHVKAPFAVGGEAADVGRQVAAARATMVLDDRMRIVRLDPPSSLDNQTRQVEEQLLTGLRTLTFPLPDSAVSVGDTWTSRIQVPYTDMTGGKPVFATMRLTVQTLEIVRGDTIAVVAMRTELPRDPIPLTMFGQPGSLSLSGTVTGAQRFSLSRGAVLSTTDSGTVAITMKGKALGPAGMHLDLKQQGTLTMISKGGSREGAGQ